MTRKFIFCLALCNFLFISPKIYANEWFVAVNGSDDNSGTKNAPFQTIHHALTKSESGDTISVRKGLYNEFIEIHDFQFQSPVTIQPYKNEHVIIDGRKRDKQTSTQAAFSIRSSTNIVIQGFEIRHITTEDEKIFPAGIIIREESKNITIKDNNIHRIANFSKNGNAHGIIVYGSSPVPITNITIEHNTIHHLTLGKSESLTVSGNVNGFKIHSNTLYDNNNIGIDVAGHYGACIKEGCLDFSRNGDIAYNTVLRHSSSENPAYNGANSSPGIYVDGGRNVRIHHNFVAHNNFGLSVSSENRGKASQNVAIFNNFIVSNDKAGLVIGGSTSENGGATNITVFNNYFIHNDRLGEGYKEITFQQNIQALRFKENKYWINTFTDVFNNNNHTTNFSYLKTSEQVFLRPFSVQ